MDGNKGFAVGFFHDFAQLWQFETVDYHVHDFFALVGVVAVAVQNCDASAQLAGNLLSNLVGEVGDDEQTLALV